MIAMMLVAARKTGAKLSLPLWLKVLGWLAAALMTVAVVLLVWSEFR
jgi:hypothetical protein